MFVCLATRLVHRRSFLLSRTFFTRHQANRLVHHRSLLLSRAFPTMKYLAMHLVHRRSGLLAQPFHLSIPAHAPGASS